ncbi:MAG TPA: hypothetical protein VN577_00685 [Terriglobales bacterium]|nr:hypothetical protein [Terriglobales bacterium]
MQLDLTEQELRTLIYVLEERLRGLRTEISHTSTYEFKTLLKEHERVLQCLHDKLVTIESMRAA